MIQTLEKHHFSQVCELTQFHYQRQPHQFNWPSHQIKEEYKLSKGIGKFDGGQLQAFILYRHPQPEVYEITALATHPDFARQAKMEELWSFWLKTLPLVIKEIWLEVHAQNISAIRFYEKVGFKKMGERPSYYSDGVAAYLYTFYLVQ